VTLSIEETSNDAFNAILFLQKGGGLMITRTVDVAEAQSQLPALIELALAGNEVVIAEGDKPLARLVPVARLRNKRVAGLNRGTIWVSEDFDDPLPDEFWSGQE
jgi:antitoxin (DNA-binding transcriptional repressor) of toxin-antitoxin stability system